MSDPRKDLARLIWEEEGRPCGAAFDEEDPCYKHQFSFLSLADTILASDVIAQVRATALWEAAARLEADFGEQIPGGGVLSTPSSRRLRAYSEETKRDAGAIWASEQADREQDEDYPDAEGLAALQADREPSGDYPDAVSLYSENSTRTETLAIVNEVITLHDGEIGTHYDGCWKRHVACLAVLIRDLAGDPDVG